MSTEAEIAWAAGFYEGEGNIQFTTVKPGRFGRTVRISINQINPEPLHKIASILGFGRVLGPYDRTRHYKNAKPIYTWLVCSAWEVQKICSMMYPWLSSKRREQIDKALDAYSDFVPGEGDKPSIFVKENLLDYIHGKDNTVRTSNKVLN